MSEENVELVRTTFETRPGDRTPRAEYFDPEFEFHEDPRLPEAGLYRGVEVALAYWEQFIENFEEFTIEPEEFVEIGGSRVLVPLMITTPRERQLRQRHDADRLDLHRPRPPDHPNRSLRGP